MNQNPASENFLKFFEWSQSFLKKHNKVCKIVPSKTVLMDGIKVAGWCDGNEMMVASNSSLFEQNYVHEFSHMQQVVNFSPYWKDEFIFWDHLQNDKIGIPSWPFVLEIIALERDCERRSLAHSKKWGLFDNKEYAKHANLYLYFYQYLFLKKKWEKSIKIYHPILLELMPETLVSFKKLKTINVDLMHLFDECLDKKGIYFIK